VWLAKILSGPEINSLRPLTQSAMGRFSAVVGVRNLVRENLVLRQTVSRVKRKHPKPQIGALDQIEQLFDVALTQV
jgi:hypothetical protein